VVRWFPSHDPGTDALIDQLGPRAQARIHDLQAEGWDIRSTTCPVSGLAIYALYGRMAPDKAKAKENIIAFRVRLDGNNLTTVKPYSKSTCQDHETSASLAEALQPILNRLLKATTEEREAMLIRMQEATEPEPEPSIEEMDTWEFLSGFEE